MSLTEGETKMILIVGNKYNFINQKERLVYLGISMGWHQFAKVEKPYDVWAELTNCDLHLIEETK